MLKFFQMKRLFFAFSLIVFLLSIGLSVQAQKTTPKKKPASTKSKAGNKPVPPPLDEKEEFNKAIAIADAAERIKALQSFIEKFPASTEIIRAKTLIVSGRAELGEQKLQAGETETGIQLFKDAVKDTPTPISENFYAKVILQFPTNLFYRGQQLAALQVAQLIENKVSDNPKQLLGLAAFYLGIERPNEARMLAESAIVLTPEMPEAYQTLGLAQRLNFELAESEKAYTKALELAPDSIISKRSLAEIKRAVGKSDEAVKLYRELVEKDANDIQASNGLILSLFDSGNRVDAEEFLGKSLEANPNNLFLLVGAAYWYASQKNGARAVELAQRAVDIEPRYTWGRIALARGFMLQNLPFEAEKVLLVARQYGSFPTLDYELASARFQAGLFEEAARELKKRFAVKDGYVQTYIAGRAAKEAETFVELLNLERQASIFTPESADTKEAADKLESLLNFSQKLELKETTEEELSKAVDEFVNGEDKMKTHRQLFAANRLLEAKKSLPKVLELTQGAVKGVDASLEVSNPAAAVLADELIESRALAIARDEVVIVPDIPTQTLSRIIRGRIEEIIGTTLYQQEKPQEAVVRLKRAVSILPEKSAWWRSSYWKLGLAYDETGNSKDALDALVKSYSTGAQDRFRRSTVEAVYRKVNGNLDGIDKLIGENPFGETISQVMETPSPTPTVENTPEATPTPQPTVEPSPTPEVKVEMTPAPTVEPSPTPEVKTEPSPTPTAEASPSPTIEATPTPVVESTPTPEPSPSPTVETTPIPVVETTPTPETKISPTPTPESSPTPTVETLPKPEVKTETSPTPKPLFEPVVIEVGKSSSTATPKPTPTPKPSPTPTETPEKKDTETSSNNAVIITDPFARPRIVNEKTSTSSETSDEENTSCLVASQETVSIFSKRGDAEILIGYIQDGDVSKITFETKNSDDITAEPNPSFVSRSNRAAFIIKSISNKKGIFTISFNSPCGKKEIQVKVL